jgi:anti-sigma factor RsiW
MASDQQRLSSLERANLVAYLDGELNEAESLQLRTKLERSASARHEAESLKRTWILLDALPRPEARPDLSAQTVSLVLAGGHPDDPFVNVAARVASQLGRLVLLAAIAVGGGAAAYAAVRWGWPDPSARLAEDLSVVEHLDEYQDLGSFEFLQELDAMPEFHQGAAQGPGTEAP